MSIVEHQPTPPHLVEVVSASSAQDVMAEVAAELATLNEELHQLDAKATTLERQLSQSRWATRDDEVAGPLLRQVFEAQAGASRAAMATALDDVVRWAEAHVAQARAAAEAMATACGSGCVPDPKAATPNLAPIDDARDDEPLYPPPVTVTTTTAHEAPVQPDAITTVMPAVVDDPPGVESADEEATAFGDFWVDSNAALPARATGTSPIDIVLPLVALLIIVVVVFSWIG